MRNLLLCCLLLIALPVGAREIAGVNVAETLQGDGGSVLHLNGAGIRTKFFFDIYIAELYMEHPASSSEGVLAAAGQKRMIMHFLYKEVGKDKLVEGWNEGFEDNNSTAELEKLKERLARFNDLFVTVKKNDVIVLDFSPASGTRVTVSGEERGVIEGKDFNDALLKIWLGEEPISSGLKKDLLDYKK
jgi:hypothetical protein